MNLKISICDDEEDFLKEFSNHINVYSFQEDIGIDVDCFQTATHILSSIDNRNNYDIYFLDIELTDANGIDIAKEIIQKSHRKPFIVFVSNYPKYMHESFSVHPYYFLQKPISHSNITKLLDEIVNDINSSNPFITLKSTSEKTHIVYLSDVLYLKTLNAKKKRMLIQTQHESIEVIGLISDWATKLSNYNFVDCYRGIIVNLEYIHYISKGTVVLQNGLSFPISHGKEQLLLQKYINQIIRK